MEEILMKFLFFILGAILTFIVCGLVNINSHSEEIEEAYNKGRKDEREDILNKIHNKYGNYIVEEDIDKKGEQL